MKRAFFGGVHPKGYKELSREAAIVPLHPSVVSVAMSQHIGAPCQPLVKVGDRVTVGQKIGDGQGLCVPVHASVSGTVTAIEARPHPGGNLQTASSSSPTAATRSAPRSSRGTPRPSPP